MHPLQNQFSVVILGQKLLPAPQLLLHLDHLTVSLHWYTRHQSRIIPLYVATWCTLAEPSSEYPSLQVVQKVTPSTSEDR